MPQPIPIMGKVLYEHMKAHNIKTVGYIGYSDSYGDLWFNDIKKQAVPMGIAVVDEERFARPDTSVAGQVLKLGDGLNGQRYRVEASHVPHGYVAAICGPQLLADAGAGFDWSRI